MAIKPIKSPGAKAGRTAPKAAASDLRNGLKQFTRQRLLDAAMLCFREKGYRETTIERIVELAGTTVPTFYRHFPSKVELLHPLIDHLSQEVETTLVELDSLEVEERKNVRRWLDTYMVMWGRVHKLCAAHWEAVNIDEAYAERLMEDGISCVSIMQNVVGRMSGKARARFQIRMSLIIMFLDRMAIVVSAERSAARANEVLEEFSKILWAVLNDSPAFQD